MSGLKKNKPFRNWKKELHAFRGKKAFSGQEFHGKESKRSKGHEERARGIVLLEETNLCYFRVLHCTVNRISHQPSNPLRSASDIQILRNIGRLWNIGHAILKHTNLCKLNL